VFGWGLGGLGWIQPSFWGRSQPVQCLVALLFLGMEPTHFSVILVFGRRIGDRVAPFSVWLKEFTVCLVGERGEPGRSEPILVAVWLEDRRVGLAPGCGLDPSVKIWRTEPLQPGWLPPNIEFLHPNTEWSRYVPNLLTKH